MPNELPDPRELAALIEQALGQFSIYEPRLTALARCLRRAELVPLNIRAVDPKWRLVIPLELWNGAPLAPSPTELSQRDTTPF